MHISYVSFLAFTADMNLHGIVVMKLFKRLLHCNAWRTQCRLNSKISNSLCLSERTVLGQYTVR
jgi:hypothetical protein